MLDIVMVPTLNDVIKSIDKFLQRIGCGRAQGYKQSDRSYIYIYVYIYYR